MKSKKLFQFSVLLACFFVSSCALLPKVTSEQYRRAMVLILVTDEIDTSRAESYFGIPRGGKLQLEGLKTQIVDTTTRVFESNGYKVQVSDVNAEEFWATARSEVKPKPLDFIAKSEGVTESLKKLVSIGRVDVSSVDVVFIIGPNEHYANENRLSPLGEIFEVNTLATKPGTSSTFVTPASSAFKAPELLGLRNSRGFDVGQVPVLNFGTDISKINEKDKEKLIKALASSYARALETMLKGYR